MSSNPQPPYMPIKGQASVYDVLVLVLSFCFVVVAITVHACVCSGSKHAYMCVLCVFDAQKIQHVVFGVGSFGFVCMNVWHEVFAVVVHEYLYFSTAKRLWQNSCWSIYISMSNFVCQKHWTNSTNLSLRSFFVVNIVGLIENSLIDERKWKQK